MYIIQPYIIINNYLQLFYCFETLKYKRRYYFINRSGKAKGQYLRRFLALTNSRQINNITNLHNEALDLVNLASSVNRNSIPLVRE